MCRGLVKASFRAGSRNFTALPMPNGGQARLVDEGLVYAE